MNADELVREVTLASLHDELLGVDAPAGPIQLFVNHTEMYGLEWGYTTEEVLGGTGRATLAIQDRTGSWSPQCHWDVKVVIRSSGWVLYRGEIISQPIDLPVGQDLHIWKFDCADYNDERKWRLVGAFDGKTWIDADALGDYVNIDPYGHSLATDKLTVQALMDNYIRVDGEAFGTDTYVGEYITSLPYTEWPYTDLDTVLTNLAALITSNLQLWSDPDLEFHWVAIPAWQDLAQDIVALGGDPASVESQTALLTPEQNPGLLPLAPFYISDVYSAFDSFQIGCRALQFTFDGSSMPEQLYVQGATGYIYNAPPVNPTGGTVVVNPQNPAYGAATTFGVTFLATTHIWQLQSDGLVASGYNSAAPGGPYNATWVAFPYNPTNHHGGHFFKLTSGPYAGQLVDNDTNYFGYGSIQVVAYVPAVVGEPTIGVGGTGWVGGATQDKNKRQAYLTAPISIDQASRDALGGQVLYRGQFPTLRGSCVVSGRTEPDDTRTAADGWRVGQLVQITDARLPSALNGRYFVIQSVKATGIVANDEREYTLGWGDGPTSRYSMQPLAASDVTWPNPANMVTVTAYDLEPGSSSSQVITGQLTNKSGQPWAIAGKTINWTLEVYDSAGTLQTGQGHLDQIVSATDANGKARTTLHTGTATGLVYFVFADCPAT